jgi:flavin-binding protein dodecin
MKILIEHKKMKGFRYPYTVWSVVNGHKIMGQSETSWEAAEAELVQKARIVIAKTTDDDVPEPKEVEI